MSVENSVLNLKYEVVADDFTRAGEASSNVKHTLKNLGVPPEVIRKVAIAIYEGEINMVIHAKGGEITVDITPTEILMALADVGPGIADVEKAMQAGFSTASDAARALGFGAGMGLPNIKKCSDDLKIETEIGVGTTLYITIKLG